MSKKDNINKKGTDRDVRPQQGQKSNENWDQNNDQRTSDTSSGRSDGRNIDEHTNMTGAGSSQRIKKDNEDPLESDHEKLPGEKRRDRGENQTGPGLG